MAAPTFQPFVPASESSSGASPFARSRWAQSSLCLFGAVTVYVGLRAGLTVAASIPISVLSISILRAFGKASILENNIVQTVGNAGQSIASGVIFTLPALIFLGFDLESTRIFALALFGGWLGVLFMIPLRRQLIVEEHGTLIYPEGTACADVLMAGERGGSFASRVFLGLGLGGLYTLFQNDNLFSLWPSGPNYEPDYGGSQHILKGSALRADCTPEYLGVGLHHRPSRLCRHARRRGLLLAGADARDLLLWLAPHSACLPRNDADREYGPERSLEDIRAADGCRSGCCRGPDHSAAHRARPSSARLRRECAAYASRDASDGGARRLRSVRSGRFTTCLRRWCWAAPFC